MCHLGLVEISLQDQRWEARPKGQLADAAGRNLVVLGVQHAGLQQRRRQAHIALGQGLGARYHRHAQPQGSIAHRCLAGAAPEFGRRAHLLPQLVDQRGKPQTRLGLAVAARHEVDAEALGHVMMRQGKRLHMHLVQRVGAIAGAWFGTHQPWRHDIHQHRGRGAGGDDPVPEPRRAEPVPQRDGIAVPAGPRDQEEGAADVIQWQIAIDHVVRPVQRPHQVGVLIDPAKALQHALRGSRRAGGVDDIGKVRIAAGHARSGPGRAQQVGLFNRSRHRQPDVGSGIEIMLAGPRPVQHEGRHRDLLQHTGHRGGARRIDHQHPRGRIVQLVAQQPAGVIEIDRRIDGTGAPRGEHGQCRDQRIARHHADPVPRLHAERDEPGSERVDVPPEGRERQPHIVLAIVQEDLVGMRLDAGIEAIEHQIALGNHFPEHRSRVHRMRCRMVHERCPFLWSRP